MHKIKCKSGDSDMVWSADGAEDSCTWAGDSYAVTCRMSGGYPSEEDGGCKKKSVPRLGISLCIGLEEIDKDKEGWCDTKAVLGSVT